MAIKVKINKSSKQIEEILGFGKDKQIQGETELLREISAIDSKLDPEFIQAIGNKLTQIYDDAKAAHNISGVSGFDAFVNLFSVNYNDTLKICKKNPKLIPSANQFIEGMKKILSFYKSKFLEEQDEIELSQGRTFRKNKRIDDVIAKMKPIGGEKPQDIGKAEFERDLEAPASTPEPEPPPSTQTSFAFPKVAVTNFKPGKGTEEVPSTIPAEETPAQQMAGGFGKIKLKPDTIKKIKYAPEQKDEAVLDIFTGDLLYPTRDAEKIAQQNKIYKDNKQFIKADQRAEIANNTSLKIRGFTAPPASPKKKKAADVSTAASITGALQDIGTAAQIAGINKTIKDLKAGKEVIMRTPEAIALLKKYAAQGIYRIKEREDGSVQVLNVKDPETGKWVTKSKPSKLKESVSSNIMNDMLLLAGIYKR